MERVIQQNENGCVSACIAMLTGLTYFEGVRITHPYRTPHSQLGSTDENTLAALKRIGLRGYIRKPKRWLQELSTNAILFIQHRLYLPAIHAVIWDYESQKVLDPYPRKDRSPSRHLPFNSYQSSVISYIEVRKQK